ACSFALPPPAFYQPKNANRPRPTIRPEHWPAKGTPIHRFPSAYIQPAAARSPEFPSKTLRLLPAQAQPSPPSSVSASYSLLSLLPSPLSPRDRCLFHSAIFQILSH
ncbi:hypothetical protein PTTG_28982, partial [Puccinia triticina 1-1 BBBD Race 1]